MMGLNILFNTVFFKEYGNCSINIDLSTIFDLLLEIKKNFIL